MDLTGPSQYLSKRKGNAMESIKNSRMIIWLAISIPLFLVVAFLSPQKVDLLVYKSVLITFSAWLGYRIDRGLFPYARPDRLAEEPAMPDSDLAFSSAMLRRAIIVAACVLAMAIGL